MRLRQHRDGRRAGILPLLALAACGQQSQPDAPPEAAPPRPAPVAAGSMRPPPPVPEDAYATDKAVARDLYKAGKLGLDAHLMNGTFDVYQCGSLPIDDAEGMDARAAADQQLAARMVQLEGDLATTGYDPAFYAGPLAALEQALRQALATGGDDAGSGAAVEAFVAATEPSRAARQPGLPPIVAEGGCGAGEVQQPFALQPDDGAAQVLRVFSFEVCARRRIDPWDTARCPGWISVRNGGSLPLAGAYRVQARWPDGRMLRSDFLTPAFAEDDRAPIVRLVAPRPAARP